MDNLEPNLAAQLLVATRKRRREVFFEKLDKSGIKLSMCQVDYYFYNPLPIYNGGNGLRDLKFTYPINPNKRLYGFKFQGDIRTISRNNYGYYLVECLLDRSNQPGNIWKLNYLNTVQFSLVYYAVYTWLSDLAYQGYRFKITDKLFPPLMEDLSNEDNPQFEFVFSVDPILDKTDIDHKVYISLFK